MAQGAAERRGALCSREEGHMSSDDSERELERRRYVRQLEAEMVSKNREILGLRAR